MPGTGLDSASVSTDQIAPLNQRRRAVTWRSLLLGTCGVALMCGIAPYNDYIVQNTWISGSYLPTALVLSIFVLVVVVNAPLHLLWPRAALSAGELAVVVAMIGIAAVPAQGITRALVPTAVSPFWFAGQDATFRKAFFALDLPSWLFPVPKDGSGPTDRIVTGFYGRLVEGEHIAWSRWVVPLLAWGAFVVALWATLLGLAAILRYQWAENERLPFPLAHIQASLIAAPSRGRCLNDTFGSAPFWIGFLAIFLIRNLNGLSVYFPRTVPQVPLGFDLAAVLSEPPWMHLNPLVKSASLYFVFIGMTFFIQSRVALSLWVFFLVKELVAAQAASLGAGFHYQSWEDQHLGASLAFLAGAVWIGRHHWGRVLRQMVGGRRGDEPRGRYLPFAWAGWMTFGGMGVMCLWLALVGVGPAMIALIVGLLLVSHVVTARVVAQTGLPAFRTMWLPFQGYTLLPPGAWSGRDIFFAGAWTVNGQLMSREFPLPFLLHGMQTYEAIDEQRAAATPDRERRRLFAAMAWALLLGGVVSAWAALRMYYGHASPLTPGVSTWENDWGMTGFPSNNIVTALGRHSNGAWAPLPYEPLAHIGFGAALMTVLQVGAWRFVNWPLAPVGYLACTTWYLQQAWLSIFIGWLAKVLVVRYGGARLYEKARPLFIGLIFGEALAAGVWMVVTLVLAGLGYPYQQVRMLPV